MQTIIGKYNQANVMIDTLDETTRSQIQGFVNNPSFHGSYIAIMPDCHAGAGSCIGFTMQMNDRIIPDVVGVDIGCLDRDTEFLSPSGWKKISEYAGEEVAQYDKDTDKISFVSPTRYIVLPCERFYKFKGHNGMDMLLSEEHKMIIWKGCKKRGYTVEDIQAADFVKHHNSLKKGIQAGIKTVFGVEKGAPLSISEEDIRVIAMISADGRIRRNVPDSPHIELRFKRERKIARARELLNKAGLSYKEHLSKDGVTTISFSGKPFYTKELSLFWTASQEQLTVLAEESIHWDGSRTVWGQPTFSTIVKENADVIQFAYAISGVRVGISSSKSGKDNWNRVYQCYGTKNTIVGFTPSKIAFVPSLDGKKYCFTVPTGYFLARRNDNIFITGNCGMLSRKFDVEHFDIPAFDIFIKEHIPSGFSIHTARLYRGADFFRDTQAKIGADVARVYGSIGTLGGGNHFIEAGYGADGKLWVTIHSGSRNFGLQIAKYHGAKAKELCQKWGADTQGIPFLVVDSPEGQDYIHDQLIGSQYASLNRMVMMEIIEGFFGKTPIDSIESRHNFIDDTGMIRKGATPAHEGERVIIPFNMRDGLALCVGKGSKKYNYSAPHGAGRILSRSKAKALLDVGYFQEDMRQAGVYTTTADAATLDESPDAYKDMTIILENIKETVDVVEMVKPVYNFKAGGE